MKRSQLKQEEQKKYCWDFSHLFADEKAWIKTLQQLDEPINHLMALKGQLNQLQNFKKYLAINQTINLTCNKLQHYLHYADLDQTNLTYQDLQSLFSNQAVLWGQKLAWIEPEIKMIGEKQIKSWIAENPDLHNYRHQMAVFFQFEKYILSEHDEALLSKVSKSRGAIDNMYDALVYADKQKAMINYQSKEQELTQTLYLDIMENTDPVADQMLRVKTNQLFHHDLVAKKHSLAQIYENIISHSIEEVNIRYNDQHLNAKEKLTPIVYSLEGDKVPLAVYHNLIAAGKKHKKLVEQFYQIKQQFFGLKQFYATDNSLKLSKLPPQKYDVATGINIIKQALQVLGPEYLAQMEIALQPGKIDYFEDTNKRTGAYSSGGNGVEPIILMNWDDTINAINTLGHELGHSVHTLFAEKFQSYPNANYPIILAEVASTVNEHLIFDYLYQNAKDDQTKIYLLQSHIETIIGTFFRQIQFADFEQKAHELVMNQAPLNADVLADLYRNIANQYGQDVLDVANPAEKPYAWTRVSHFFHSPFYVYKYATSITVSFKLYEDIKAGNTENLLTFLKAGGHDYPLNILQAVGVDLTQTNVYNPLVNNLQTLISELQGLVTKNDSKKEK